MKARAMGERALSLIESILDVPLKDQRRSRRDWLAPPPLSRFEGYRRDQQVNPQDWLMIKAIPEPNSGCWLWEGSVSNRGYGLIPQLTRGVEYRLAHRESYRRHIGIIPFGMCVCHCCDVPTCVNPDHLFLGTQKDNIQDAINKTRFIQIGRCGEDHPSSKLTNKEVEYIRKSKERGIDLANWFDISEPTICNIRKNKRRMR